MNISYKMFIMYLYMHKIIIKDLLFHQYYQLVSANIRLRIYDKDTYDLFVDGYGGWSVHQWVIKPTNSSLNISYKLFIMYSYIAL